MDSLDILGEIALRYPRLSGGASVALAALVVIGLVCGQIDADKLERTHPTAAKAVRVGQKIGALAVALWASSKLSGKGEGTP